jgi:hypothetical protein
LVTTTAGRPSARTPRTSGASSAVILSSRLVTFVPTIVPIVTTPLSVLVFCVGTVAHDPPPPPSSTHQP